MASLTDPVQKQNIVDRFADYVVSTANSGISWGTNAYPFPECDFTGIFGGTTSGKSIESSGSSISEGPVGEITADYIFNTLLQETNRYTRIRNIRCVLNVTGAGGNTGTRPTKGDVFDKTLVAHLNSSYQVSLSVGRSDVSSDNTVTSTGLETLFSNMRTNYDTTRATSAGTFTTSVCHASCHSSCHSSRGRR